MRHDEQDYRELDGLAIEAERRLEDAGLYAPAANIPSPTLEEQHAVYLRLLEEKEYREMMAWSSEPWDTAVNRYLEESYARQQQTAGSASGSPAS